MKRLFTAVAFFVFLSSGVTVADGWFMKRVEVPVFHADIIEVRKVLLEMVPGVGLGVDPVRNLLLVHGTDEQVEVVQELLQVGERPDNTLDLTAIQTTGPIQAESASWQSGIVREYLGDEQVREYKSSRVFWLKTARSSDE